MALIDCPECGKSVSDSAKQCPNCGFGVDVYVKRQIAIENIRIESEKEALEYVRNKMAEEQEKIENDYLTARQYYETTESYKIYKVVQAISIFESLGDYKDSKEMIKKCEDKIKELNKQKEEERIESERKREVEQKEKKKRIIKTTIIISSFVLLVIIFVFIYNTISNNISKGNIENSMKNKMWEKSFDYVVQSGIPQDEKDSFLKQILPNMKKCFKKERFDNFTIKEEYIDDSEGTSNVLILKYDNGKNKTIYKAEESKEYDEYSSYNKVWVSGTEEYIGDFIYGNGKVLFVVESQTKFKNTTSDLFEERYYEYDIENDDLNLLETELDSFRLNYFAKLQDGKILIKKEYGDYIYNPYANTTHLDNYENEYENELTIYETYHHKDTK